MNNANFTHRSPGKLVKNFDGNWAFVPAPLPPNLNWNAEVILAISHADQKLGVLTGLGKKLKNPNPLIRMFLRREAELSSKIENTFADVQELLLFEQFPEAAEDAESVREVHNNFRTLEFALASAQHRGLTRSLVKEMHAILLRGVRGGDKTPGKFRTVQAHIGRTNNIREARFVPCPPHEIENCMEQLQSFLTTPGELPPVVRAALAHYQFEAIHPFADGNGRVGRALLLLQLVKEDVLPAPLLNPSAQLELRRDEYYDRLLAVSQKGQWLEWIAFFAENLAAEAVDAAARIDKLDQLREEYYHLVRTPRASALLPRLIDELFSEPSMTIKGTSNLLDITFRSAGKLLERLEELGIIREVTGRLRGRVYLAQDIINLFATSQMRHK